MRRKRVDSEDDLDKSKDSASDNTPPPSIIIPRKSVSKSPKKAKTSSVKKKKSDRTTKVKGFLGAIELTSESEDDKTMSKAKKFPQTRKKKPPDSEIINLCSDEDIVSKSPSRKPNYTIEDDVVVILSSSDDEKLPSSKIASPQENDTNDMDCGRLDALGVSEKQPPLLNSPPSSQVDHDTANSTTTISSPFSAPPTNIPPRVIVFSDGIPPPTLQTSLYFSRTLASVQTSLSYRRRDSKSTKPNSDTEHTLSNIQPSLPPSSPPPSSPPPPALSPPIQSETQQNLFLFPDIPILQSNMESGSSSADTLPGSIAEATKPHESPFLPSPTPEDIALPDFISEAMETCDQKTLLHSTSSPEDIIPDIQPQLSEDTTSIVVPSTTDTVDETNDYISATPPIEIQSEERSAEAIPSTPSQIIDLSVHSVSDIAGLDASSLTEGMDDDLAGLELAYPDWLF